MPRDLANFGIGTLETGLRVLHYADIMTRDMTRAFHHPSIITDWWFHRPPERPARQVPPTLPSGRCSDRSVEPAQDLPERAAR